MSSTRDVIRLVGADVLAQELGVGKKSLSHAAVKGVFPARWYVVIKRHCDVSGVDCPYQLFSFIVPIACPPEREVS